MELAILLATLATILSVYLAHTATVWVRYILFQIKLRYRYREIRVASSKRAGRLLDILDIADLGEDVLDLLQSGKYVRAAVLISRDARLALRYPKHSVANERIVCDWIDKHLPEGMTRQMKHRVVPLAVKLSFVKSRYEIAADQQFDWMDFAVDKA